MPAILAWSDGSGPKARRGLERENARHSVAIA
jgi:hypothetical protein